MLKLQQPIKIVLMLQHGLIVRLLLLLHHGISKILLQQEHIVPDRSLKPHPRLHQPQWLTTLHSTFHSREDWLPVGKL